MRAERCDWVVDDPTICAKQRMVYGTLQAALADAKHSSEDGTLITVRKFGDTANKRYEFRGGRRVA